MNRQFSFATRAFLLAFIPMALTLAASFIFVSKAVEGRIKVRMRDSLQKTEEEMSRRDADYSRHNLRALAALTENSSLKAGIGLLRETRDPALQGQAQETLASQLRQMAESMDYDLLLIEDSTEKPLVGVIGEQRVRLIVSAHPVEVVAPSLIRVHGDLYESMSVPINLGDENLGILTVGRQFNVRAWSEFGDTALIQNGRILLTSFPVARAHDAELQVQSKCKSASGECEVEIGGEAFLAMPVRQETFKGSVRLISFQSIDAATSEFTRSLTSVFSLIGGAGIVFVFLFCTLGARSVAKPLVNLVAQLKEKGSAGEFATELKSNYQTAEVNELALEFTRAAGAIRESERQLDEATLQFIESMAQAQDARDPYTAGHSERVSANSTAVAMAMGLGPAEVEIIRIGAKLHDIGKIGIPDAVLRKPGKLTRDEYTLIQRHPRIGKEILEKVDRFKDFLPIVELHHENPNGSGYPNGLTKDEIPLGVRIVHVTDVYDAITSDRSYRKAMSQTQAWDLLRKGTGPLFDPDVVEALWAVLEKQQFPDTVTRIITPHEMDLAFYSLPTRGN